MDRKGILLVLSGPSGAGKGTICRALQQDSPALVLSVSATTRPPRSGEVDGVHYHFLEREVFQEMIEDDQLLEWAEVYGHYYGTPRRFVLDTLEEGKDLILEIDIQGALQVKEKFPESVLIFIAPPSKPVLISRLFARGTDAPEEIQKRLSCTASEMKLAGRYDYLVLNDQVTRALETIRSIILAEKSRPRYFTSFIAQFTH